MTLATWVGAGVHRVDRPSEAAGQQVAQDLVADGGRLAAGTDHRDGPRGQSSRATERASARCSRVFDRRPGFVGRFDRQLDVHDAIGVARPFSSNPAAWNTSSIRRLWGSVSATNRVIPCSRAAAARCSSSTVADPPALMLVGDDERHLGLALVGRPVVAGDADDLVAQLGDERHPGVVVDVGEMLDLGGTQPWLGREEPRVHGVRREAFVEGDQRRAVVGPDRAHVDGAPVDQHGIGLPVHRRGDS